MRVNPQGAAEVRRWNLGDPVDIERLVNATAALTMVRPQVESIPH